MMAMDELSNLGFDVERHREALNAFSRMDLDPRAVRPALRARDLVLVRVPSGKFRIGVERSAAPERAEGSWDCIQSEVICEAAEPDEAEAIRAEVERYFLRHFPGRTLTAQTPSPGEKTGPCRVFIALYAPESTGA
jgi:hypothetical protein